MRSRQSRELFGSEFGQVEAVTRYHAMRQTPDILEALDRGRLVATYSGVNRRRGAQALGDLDFVFMPAGMLLAVAGRLVDSLVTAGSEADKGVYVTVAGATGTEHRLRVAPGSADLVGRLTGAEVDLLADGQFLTWGAPGAVRQVRSFPQEDFHHPPVVVVAGQPVSQTIQAVAPVAAWEAELIELLRRSRQKQ